MAPARILGGIFGLAFAILLVQVLTVYAPPFFQYLTVSYAPGQAIRAALFWIGAHVLAPLAAAILGAALFGFVPGRKGGNGPG